jgi:hypothetical protein
VVTRGILQKELQPIHAMFRAMFEHFDRRFDETHQQFGDLLKQFAEHRTQTREDMLSAVRMVQADFAREQALALEPTKKLPERVAVLEATELSARVRRLEAKVFPAKRTRRR